MFKCKECESTEFHLVLNPSFKGDVDVSTNEHDEVVVKAGAGDSQQEFIADLLFMNQFAVCSDCGAIKQWDYFFPKAAVNS